MFAIGLAAVLAACAQEAPPPEPITASPPPPVVVEAPPKVVYIEKPAPPPKTVVVEKPAPPRKRPPDVVIIEQPASRSTSKTVIVEKQTTIVVGVKQKAKPVSKSACRGLAKDTCVARAGCQWITHTETADKNGRPLKDYCRKSA
jgi:hypothetical protein